MELRSCYFCGSTGRTLATRELVPDGETAAPVDVVLCPDCDAKLDRLLDRLLDRSGSAGDGTTESDSFDFSTEITFDESDGADGTADAAGPDVTEADATDGPSETDPTDGPSEADAGDGDVFGNSTAAGGVDVGTAPTGGTETGTDEEPDADEGSDDGAEADDEEDSEADEESGDDAGADATGTSETDGEAADGDADGGSSGGLRGLGESSVGTYRKALRLLQNREFPMERTDLVEVMSSAYDIDRRECQRLVDLAVERGWLVEDGDELRRG
ncbi:MAG: hypothetical protein ABEH47_03970 [Haloferacaceae archaeon]